MTRITESASVQEAQLKQPVSPDRSLSHRVTYAGLWVFALRIATQLLRLVRILVLARLLSSEDFGLFGIAMLSLSVLEVFLQTGFDHALIQKRTNIRPYLDTAWTVQIIQGCMMATILVLGAPLVSAFFEEPRAGMLIQVMGGVVLLRGLNNIGVVYFRKELEFRKQLILEFGGAFADLLVSIPAAFILRSVWALLFGLLVGNLVRSIISYVVHPYRPSFRLGWREGKELFSYGRWVLGSSSIHFLLNQGDDALVGRLLGVSALGLYQLAYRVSNTPATQVTHVISQVTFPAYSKLQEDMPQLRRAFLKTLQISAFVSIPLAGAILILAPDFTVLFLGEKWMPMVPAMQVLAIWGGVRSIGVTIGPVFNATGRPDILTKLALAKLTILAALIYPFSKEWGIVGTSIAVVAAALFSNPVSAYIVIKKIECSVWTFCKQLVFPLTSTLGMVVLIVITKNTMGLVSTYEFFLLLMLAGTVYMIEMFMINWFFDYGLGTTIVQQISLLRGAA